MPSSTLNMASLNGSTPASKATHADEALERLRQAIVTGDLRPNQRLVEAEVARMLGISRTPVREALKHLEMQGYVSRSPGGGVVVTDHSPSQIRNLYEIREALETMAIKLACQRATHEQLDRAARYHALSFEAVNKRDIARFIELNSAFHNELLSACGNEQLWSLLQTFRDQSYDRRLVRVFNASDWRTMLKHHQGMLDAVRQQNPDKAEKIVREHIKIALRLAIERL